MNAVADHRDICPQLERCFYDWNRNLPLIAFATTKLSAQEFLPGITC